MFSQQVQLCMSEILNNLWVYCVLRRLRLQMVKSQWIQQWRRQCPKAARRHPEVVLVRLLSDRLLSTGSSEVVNKLLLISQNQSGVRCRQCQLLQGSRFVLGGSPNKSVLYRRWQLSGKLKKRKCWRIWQLLENVRTLAKIQGSLEENVTLNCLIAEVMFGAIRVLSSIVHTHLLMLYC